MGLLGTSKNKNIALSHPLPFFKFTCSCNLFAYILRYFLTFCIIFKSFVPLIISYYENDLFFPLFQLQLYIYHVYVCLKAVSVSYALMMKSEFIINSSVRVASSITPVTWCPNGHIENSEKWYLVFLLSLLCFISISSNVNIGSCSTLRGYRRAKEKMNYHCIISSLLW